MFLNIANQSTKENLMTSLFFEEAYFTGISVEVPQFINKSQCVYFRISFFVLQKTQDE